MNDCKVLNEIAWSNCLLGILHTSFKIRTLIYLMSLFVQRILKLLIATTILPAGAELTSLSDNDLSEVDGAGIGLVMDDFVFSHGHDVANDKTFRITGLTSTVGETVTVNVNQLYIARSGSLYGSDLKGVNLGRLNNPYEIDLIDGDDIGLAGEAVLQLSAPTKVDAALGYDCLSKTATLGSGECSSRPSTLAWENGERPDMGLELEINVGANVPKNLNFNVESAVFDGSYVRLWGDGASSKMAAEFRLNFYTPQLEISTCSQANQGCTSSIKMQDFELELALGHTFQPLYIGADNVTGGMTIEIAKITHQYLSDIDLTTGLSNGTSTGDEAFTFFSDYYSNPEYRSNIIIGDLDIGGTSLGSSKIEGILIQHLDVKFRDLSL